MSSLRTPTNAAADARDVDLVSASAALRAEATKILDADGLRDILAGYGQPEVTGSYTLDLMTWRDLDNYVLRDGLGIRAFCEMGARIAEELRPVRMQFRNERIGRTPGLPDDGLYWGVYLPPSDTTWKIDIWAVDVEQGRRMIAAHNALKARLTPETRRSILRIKSALCGHALYRKSFVALDIYRAVLDDGVRETGAFAAWLKTDKNVHIQWPPDLNAGGGHG